MNNKSDNTKRFWAANKHLILIAISILGLAVIAANATGTTSYLTLDFIFGRVCDTTTVTNAACYGATGDGVTDDTAFIQLAMNSSHHVYVPEGTYITGILTQYQNDSIFECSPNAKLVLKSGTDDSRLWTTPNDKVRHNITIRNCYLDGNDNGQNADPSIQGVITFEYVENFKALNNIIVNAYNDGIRANTQVSQGIIEGNTIINTNRTGVKVTYVSNISIVGNEIQGATSGINVWDNSHNIFISENNLYNASGTGADVIQVSTSNPNTLPVRDITITHNVLQYSGRYGIGATYLNNSVISNNIISQADYCTAISKSTNVIVSSNSCRAMVSSGIAFNGVRNSSIIGNTVDNSSIAIVALNLYGDGASYNSQQNIVSGNFFSHGMLEQATADHNIFVGNVYHDSGAFPFVPQVGTVNSANLAI